MALWGNLRILTRFFANVSVFIGAVEKLCIWNYLIKSEPA
jgi:hypothetical protein